MISLLSDTASTSTFAVRGTLCRTTLGSRANTRSVHCSAAYRQALVRSFVACSDIANTRALPVHLSSRKLTCSSFYHDTVRTRA